LLRFIKRMKGIKLLFAVLLAPLVFQAAFASDDTDIARAATRRGTTTTLTSSRQKSSPAPQTIKKSEKPVVTSRTTGPGISTRERATTTRSTSATTDTIRSRHTETKTLVPRTDTTNVSTRKSTAIQSRTSTPPSVRTSTRSAVTPARPGSISTPRTASVGTTRQPARSATRSATISRNATDTPTIEIGNHAKCREVFYNCMDEFCANKDSQLKRCACSSRISEFDNVKADLANAEEKLLDFSQRLLTVSMDKEDAEALYKPTEGELAFNQQDTSESKEMLDEIAKKLNSSFNNSNFDQNLNAISLSLNIDSAFDTVDSLAGASTTAKSGPALHSAALPVCREMALEVCSIDELTIAESGYQMLIEQDCNTVKKAYQTQVDQTRQRIFESNALLDISRLNTHQDRNSDDILTCRQKMLDMLTDSTVCGSGLGQCLDTTGRYIDPSTGQAFLTTHLSDLSKLIVRPDAGQPWTSIPNNQRFVSFLNTKKTFIEPAMEKCQDISDYVWDLFIEDALAQIKLAQDAKLEEIRQSCTTLTTQCLDETADSIADFDARALSIFGVWADKTVNAMCSEVQTACTALIQSTDSTNKWLEGMTGIATEKTYETILTTCQEVGRNCIIQACTSITGNFGLCENIDTSINRNSIINGSTCWNKVVSCVTDASSEALKNMKTVRPLDANGTFYSEMYNITDKNRIVTESDPVKISGCITTTDDKESCVFDRCAQECQSNDSTTCYACRLAERIWGNCEVPPQTDLTNEDSHNKIKIPVDTYDRKDETGTLLSWFAKNTGTIDRHNSCLGNTCGYGQTFYCDRCVDKESIDGFGIFCEKENQFIIFSDHSNCCQTNETDSWHNCCRNQDANGNYSAKTQRIIRSNTVSLDDNTTTVNVEFGSPTTVGKTICTPPSETKTPRAFATYTDPNTGTVYNLVCFGELSGTTPTEQFPAGQTIQCNGNLLWIDENGAYSDKTNAIQVNNNYLAGSMDTCVYDGANNWNLCNYDTQQTSGGTCTPAGSVQNWYISYQNICAVKPITDCK